MQITTYRPTETSIITIPNATTPQEVIERVREASATTADIQRFLRAVGEHLTPADMRVVEYALARACHRENRDLTIKQLALLAETTVERVLHHLKMLEIPFAHRVTCDEATRVMLRIAD